MRVILEPKVYLIGASKCGFDLPEYLKDNDSEGWTTNAQSYGEALCEIGGRVCYDSFNSPRPGGNKAYMERILSSFHGSVIEHAVYTFIFSDISRSCTHELVRHRAGWAYSQRSQRYVNEEDADFVLPEGLVDPYVASLSIKREETEGSLLAKRVLTDPFFEWKTSCELALSAYRSLVSKLSPLVEGEGGTEKRKKLRQTARSVLPSCVATTIQCTVNARALRHFLEMRASPHADPEIRKLAIKIYEKVVKIAPVLFGDYVRTGDSLETQWRKV